MSKLGEVSQQVWTFVESQCFDSESGDINSNNVTFWLRTLLQQNSDLVEMVAKLEKTAKEKSELDNRRREGSGDFTERLEELQQKVKEEADDKVMLEEAIGELEMKLQRSEEDNKASELLVDALSDKNRELEAINDRLKENMNVVEEDNQNLKEYVDNLRSDIDNLLKLTSRARDHGVWDPHDLSFCEVTFEQVFGSADETQDPVRTVRKVSRAGPASQQSSQLYDSRCVSSFAIYTCYYNLNE